MISAGSSTCGAEAEPAAEDDAETEAEAGGDHGRNNCSQFSDRGSEVSAAASVVLKCCQSLSPRTLPLAVSMSATNAEAKAGLQKQRQTTPAPQNRFPNMARNLS